MTVQKIYDLILLVHIHINPQGSSYHTRNKILKNVFSELKAGYERAHVYYHNTNTYFKPS